MVSTFKGMLTKFAGSLLNNVQYAFVLVYLAFAFLKFMMLTVWKVKWVLKNGIIMHSSVKYNVGFPYV